MVNSYKMGPGTLTLGSSPLDVSAQVTSCKVAASENVSSEDAIPVLSGDEIPGEEDVTLEWATYYDAADQAGLSRIYGGIHIAADDFTGRRLGSECGKAAWALAQRYYAGHAAAAS